MNQEEKMIILRILFLVSLIGSIIWFIVDPGLEQALAIVAALIALISSYLIKNIPGVVTKQHQTIKDGSSGIQAGRDIELKGNSKTDE